MNILINNYLNPKLITCFLEHLGPQRNNQGVLFRWVRNTNQDLSLRECLGCW